jgi:hypothetical protein
VSSWGQFEAAQPELAAFGATCLNARPAYLATLRQGGGPRVHPVTPAIGGGHLFVFMEPSSPKSHDLQERHVYSLHNGVPDMNGTGGEFAVSGSANLVEGDLRELAAEAAPYEPAARYILFELSIIEARCNGYGDVALPITRRWRDRSSLS